MTDISGIIQSLNHGSLKDQIEAITIVRGNVGYGMLKPFFENYEIDSLKKKVAKMQPLSLSDNDTKELLDALANASTKPNASKFIEGFICWYGTVVMVQFGELTQGVLKFLWATATNMMATLRDLGENNPVAAGAAEPEVREETIRALSRFKDYPEVGNMLEECLNDEALKGRQPTKKYPVLCAFGALGFQEYRKVVEDRATQDYDKYVQNAAKAALELWGRGSYDDINRAFESKSGISSHSSSSSYSSSGSGSNNSSSSGGCFIATACYGSYDAPEVIVLRGFRDTQLSKSYWGRAFIRQYYKYAPYVARKLQNKPTINNLVKHYVLDKVVQMLTDK